MFLDDQLYEHVKATKLTNADDFQTMLRKLWTLCDNYKKDNLHEGMSKQEVMVILNKTFNHWDSMIRRLTKEDYFLIDFLAKYSYKNLFLSEPVLKKVYDSLK